MHDKKAGMHAPPPPPRRVFLFSDWIWLFLVASIIDRASVTSSGVAECRACLGTRDLAWVEASRRFGLK